MDYDGRLKALVERTDGGAQERKALAESPPLSLGFARFLVIRQWRYLAWTVALLALQVAEVGILAFSHFIYFPPESLELLRVLSALSLVGMLVAKAHRSLPRGTLADGGDDRASREPKRVLLVAQCLFLLGCAASFGMSLWIALGTELHLSTPPIYRAVLFAGLLALPFDLFSTYVFYNLRAFRPGLMRRDFRPIAIGVHVVALGLLYLDLTVAFMVTVLAPRLLVTGLLWRRTSGRSLLAIGVLDVRRGSDAARFLARLGRRSAMAFGHLFVLELSLLLMFSRVTRADDNLALLLFFAHKMVHVATALGIKTNLYYAERLRRAARVLDHAQVRRIVGRIAVAVVVYIGLALALFPLLVAKRNLVFWVSPTGTSTELSAWLIAMLVVLVVARGIVSVAASWLASQDVSAVRLLLGVSLILTPALWGLRASPGLVWAQPVEEVFSMLLVVDGGACAIATAWILVGARASAPPGEARPSVGSLMRSLASDRGSRHSLLLLELWPRTRTTVFSRHTRDSLHAHAGEHGIVLRWGRNHAFVLRPRTDEEEHRALDETVRRQYAGVLRGIAAVHVEAGAPAAAMSSLLGTEAWARALADLDRRPTRLGPRTTAGLAGDTGPGAREADDMARALVAFAAGDDEARDRLPTGAVPLRRHPVQGWSVAAVEPEAARDAIGRYLGRRGPDGAHVAPGRRGGDEAAVLVAMRGRDPAALLWLPAEERAPLGELRRALLRHNLQQVAEASP